MKKWRRIPLLFLALFVVLFAAWVTISAIVPGAMAEPAAPMAHELTWDVVANGGATMSSSSYTLLSTAGQPVAGRSASSGYNLLSGYWAGIQEFMTEVFLPIIMAPS